MITGVHKVVGPVDDEQRAKEFWTERMGFTATRDETYGDERWIEVSPPQGSPVLVLSRRAEGEGRPAVRDELPQSPIFFNCDDIEATFRELSDRGVSFPSPPAKMHLGWWAMFEDEVGCRYALGQWT